MTWLSRNIPSVAPRGDTHIGDVKGGKVFITREFLRWLDSFRIRVQDMRDGAGTIRMTAASVEPDGWLFLNGQLVEERLYPDLAEIFGATGGYITLPDYSDRIAMGAGALVSLNGTAGAATVTLTTTELPTHNHAVADKGHTHGATDKGHGHGFQAQSHTHEVTESAHTHTINDPGHTHAGIAKSTAVNQSADGGDHNTPASGATNSATTGISVNSATTDLEIDPAEVSGDVMKGRAEIKVERARSNISTQDNGDQQPFSIIPPVFGVNWMVKT